MKASAIIIGAMVLTEIGTNLHAFFPPAFIAQAESNGLIAQTYHDVAVDPWTVRMVSLSLASALMLFLWSWMKMDNKAPAYLRAWGFYFIFQGVQKMAGLNVAPYDWPFDAAIMGLLIAAAYVVNRFEVRVEFTPQLMIVWRKP